jgi:hypothetical protein
MAKKLFIGYILAAALLFLFSYTQVDLSLTLSRLSIYQTVEKNFQYIGFYQRPLATGMFVGLVVIFFALYVSALRTTLTFHGLRRIVIAITLILVFSYPAFSYDIFNYMFDAKTVLVYHKIPYTVIPLQFSGVEPWLSFMHWTHIPSTFMPFWITLSLPAYLLGFGYFLGILWSFKALVAGAYLVTVWFIWKILSELELGHALYGTAMFALNPLVIFETLVSGHYDMVMMAFAVTSFYLYLHKKRLASFVLLSCSAATKIMTIALVPLFMTGWQRKWSIVATAIGFAGFIFITKREILPWYLIWFIPWYALLPRIKWLALIGTGASLGLLLTYAPFLYFGNYDPPVQTLKFWVAIIPIIVSIGIVVIRRLICPPKRPQV